MPDPTGNGVRWPTLSVELGNGAGAWLRVLDVTPAFGGIVDSGDMLQWMGEKRTEIRCTVHTLSPIGARGVQVQVDSVKGTTRVLKHYRTLDKTETSNPWWNRCVERIPLVADGLVPSPSVCCTSTFPPLAAGPASMATPPPHGHRLLPLRALLLALPALSLLLLLTIHLPTRHRPIPPAPLILPTPLRTTTATAAAHRSAKADPSSSSSSPSTTTLSHVVFGIASSGRTLPKRLPLLRVWLRPPARAFLYLDAAPRATSPLPANLHLRVSRNASRFPYTHRRGLPSAVRVARIVKELLLELRHHQQPRWLVLGDDDTAFVLPNLLHTLSKYDWREPWYIGARSESAAQNVLHAFAMAFGGGGIAISWPLAARLARVLDSCIIRYPHLYGSDGRIYACLAELGVDLTHEPGFHQIDLHGDISGLLRAHPLAPLVSLHHLDHVYPLYPGMDRGKAVDHFFRAANADPARILQQTVCYDPSRSLTASVAWGYSVQVFKGNVPLLDLLAVQKTFVPWRRGRNVTDVFMFNTKHYPRDECKRAALFFLKSISSGEGKTESNYSRQLPEKCLVPNLIPMGNLQQIRVTSELLHLVPGKALRRHCCDIIPSSSEIAMDINIRKCKDDELISMHS